MKIHCDDISFIVGIQGWFGIWITVDVIHHVNRSKEKNHILLADAEKVCDKIQ